MNRFCIADHRMVRLSIEVGFIALGNAGKGLQLAYTKSTGNQAPFLGTGFGGDVPSSAKAFDLAAYKRRFTSWPRL